MLLIDIKVSVVIVTFNQQDYIKEAIMSVLEQKVTFPYEIIIADDGSTDETMRIVSEFKELYPDKIVLLESKRNGILKNSLRVHNYIRGEYVAFLDGDDYWIFNEKLQRQTSFLDNNKDYNGVFHDAEIKHEEGFIGFFHKKKLYSQRYQYSETIFLPNLLQEVLPPTSAMLIRTNSIQKRDLKLLFDAYSIDWKLWILAIKYSKFYYINEAWGVYRDHRRGVSKGYDLHALVSCITFIKKIAKNDFYKFYRFEIYNSISRILFKNLPSLEKKERILLSLNLIYIDIKKNYYSFLKNVKKNKNEKGASY